MAAHIARHPTVREQWAAQLVKGGLATGRPQELVDRQMDLLQSVLDSLKPDDALEPQPEPPPPGAARHVKTALPATRLLELHTAMLQVPNGFRLNPKLERAMSRRRTALDDPDQPAVDWATAESLAFASILADGIAIRLTGQDVERGTFSQRHAVFHDVESGRTFVPLQALPQAKAAFAVYNSPLTESATLGFEYGYNVQEPGRLVLWEAQYGDFINAAQVMIDEFVTAARAKWGQTPSLVLLLPHAYEGQGPDHSSARLERFLQLAAELNMRIVYPTTAAQYFHVLRRQALLLQTDPLPLIVMSPKSLLRHPQAASTLRDLSEGRWHAVMGDPEAEQHPAEVRRLILCSGKVFVDLAASEQRQRQRSVAVVRVEQLYPFPEDDVQHVLQTYPSLEEVVWLQEEPANMGAWNYVRPLLHLLLNNRWPLRFIGRPPNSSPAEGSAAWHAANQRTIVSRAYDLAPEPVLAE
jgi:2-oxoglutarate dehydrogenase E1 component